MSHSVLKVLSTFFRVKFNWESKLKLSGNLDVFIYIEVTGETGDTFGIMLVYGYGILFRESIIASVFGATDSSKFQFRPNGVTNSLWLRFHTITK